MIDTAAAVEGLLARGERAPGLGEAIDLVLTGVNAPVAIPSLG